MKHKRLYEAILLLECLLKNIDEDSEDLHQAAQYSQELLIMMYKNYEQMLGNLGEQIATYEVLFNDIESDKPETQGTKKQVHGGQL